MPGYFNLIGAANADSTVTVGGSDGSLAHANRYGEYYRGELLFTNTSAAQWLTVGSLAVLNSGPTDILATASGLAVIPKTPVRARPSPMR